MDLAILLIGLLLFIVVAIGAVVTLVRSLSSLSDGAHLDKHARAVRRRARVGRRPRVEPRSGQTSGSEADERRVKILMVGYSGSGKTLLLASLYHSFAVGTPEGIRFHADDDPNRRLVKIADTIRDPRRPLPVGTPGTEGWQFAVRVESRTTTAKVFTLEFTDYAGGFFDRMLNLPDEKLDTELDAEFPEELEKALKEADVLVGVLDGERLVRLMEDGPPDSGVVGGIERLLNILSRTDHPNIHLVITKWDKLRTRGGVRYTANQVRKRLEQVSESFRSFCESPKRASSMRLIPVSVFGMKGVRGEAEWEWKPWNIQVPFFAALPDILAGDIPVLKGETGSPLSWVGIDILKTAGLFIGKAAGSVEVGIPVGFFVVKIPADKALQWVVASVRRGNRRGKVPDPLTGDAALRYVVNRSFAALRRFEAQTRGSRVRIP